MKKTAKKRPKKYNKKVTMRDDVTFSDLVGVAINYQSPKKKTAPKKKKAKK